MDNKTRGFVESAIMDTFTQRLETVVDEVEWIENEIPISSVGELALGFMVGILQALSYYIVQTITDKGLSEQDKETIRAMLKRRLPEIMEKINRELNR